MRFGVQFARVIVAISASTIMTSTVVTPMAFQAHAARSGQSDTQIVDSPYEPRPSVLNESETNENPLDTANAPGDSLNGDPSSPTSSAPSSQRSRGLYYAPAATQSPPEPARELNAAKISDPSFVIVSLPEVAGVEFFIDGTQVALASLPPWELYLGTHVDPSRLSAGTHVLRAQVTFASGAVGVREATFSTLG